MKKILALILVLILAVSGTLSAFAEEGSAEKPPQSSGPMDGTAPPEPPDGGMPGHPGGTPPDGMPGGFGGGTPPGGRSSSCEYSAAAEITEASEISGQA